MSPDGDTGRVDIAHQATPRRPNDQAILCCISRCLSAELYPGRDTSGYWGFTPTAWSGRVAAEMTGQLAGDLMDEKLSKHLRGLGRDAFGICQLQTDVHKDSNMTQLCREIHFRSNKAKAPSEGRTQMDQTFGLYRKEFSS